MPKASLKRESPKLSPRPAERLKAKPLPSAADDSIDIFDGAAPFDDLTGNMMADDDLDLSFDD